MMKKIIAALCIMFVVVTTVSAAAHDFISYASVSGIREWDDDVIERCDFVIDAGVEVGEEE